MTLVEAGEKVPDIQSPAKLVGNIINAIVGALTTSAVLALVPDDVIPDATIIAIGGVITLITGAVVTYLTRNTLTEPIVVNPPLPPVDPAVPVDGVI